MELERLKSALAPAWVLQQQTGTPPLGASPLGPSSLGASPLGTTFGARAADGTAASLLVLDQDVVARLRDPQRFVDAMRDAGRRRHPALVAVLDAGVTPAGDVWAATEPAGTATARARLAGARLPSADEVGAAGLRLTEALSTLHAAGLVHGGIAPDSVVWGAAGEGARLGQVGLHGALVAGGLAPREASELVASVAYQSPEQASGRPLDARSDIYALGATLYELLIGRPPFGGRTTSAVMASVLADEEPSMVATDEQSPGHVVTALLRAIEKAPDDRWQRAADFGTALAGTASTTTFATATPLPRFGCLPGVIIFLSLGWALMAHAGRA